MKNICLNIIILFIVLTVSSQNNKQYFVVLFLDKPNYQLDSVSSYISPKSLAKRQLYQTNIVTIEDCPVYQPYIDSVLALDSQIKLKTKSNWFNYIVITANATIIPLIERLSFVYQVDSLKNIDFTYLLKNDDLYPPSPKRFKFVDSLSYPESVLDSAYYGAMYHQISMLSGQYLHTANYQGQNMTIAVIDGDFSVLDTLEFTKEWYANHVQFSYNCTDEHSIVITHGVQVLSIMASNQPYWAIGTAPYANYVLLKSEVSDKENLVEEFFFVRALEICDSLGVDVVNVSLGYTTFDDIEDNHTYSHLDGLHSVASIAASRLARKNTIVVIAAGNEGNKPWKYITIPADSKDALTIAAIDRDSIVAPFSSRGNNDVFIVKPSIVALGKNCSYIDIVGNIDTQGNGTSLATPLITGLAACLWQAFPHYTAQDISQAIVQSASNYTHADTIIGYGIPNFWKAYLLLQQDDLVIKSNKQNVCRIYPTITNNKINIEIFEKSKIHIYNQIGMLIYSKTLNIGTHDISFEHLTSGVYLVCVRDKQYGLYTKKIVKQ